MIHLVTCSNRAVYTVQTQALHRARKAVFVDELGWNLTVRDGMEFDDYDDERSLAVIGFSHERDVAMSVRLRPADDRSMLMDHFAHALPSSVRPIDDGRTWEVSRGFCRELGRRPHNLRRKAACMLAPLEIALKDDVDRLVGFSDVRMLTFFLNIGWRITILGEAIPYGEGDGFAYDVEVSSLAVEAMRAKWSLPDPTYICMDFTRTTRRCPFEFEEDAILSDPHLAILSPRKENQVKRAENGDYFHASVGQFASGANNA